MNKKVILSLALIILAVAAVGGATMAWFTDSAKLDNTFTAGTLVIEGSDYWVGYDPGAVWQNVNPGDCKDKSFTINNIGSKHALLRFKWTGEWVGMPEGNVGLVTVTAPAGWVKDGDYYYYVNGPLVPSTGTVTFALKVCIDGAGTDNKYQGKSFSLDFTFEAIQASNNASGDLWGVDSAYNNPPSELAVDWKEFKF